MTLVEKTLENLAQNTPDKTVYKELSEYYTALGMHLRALAYAYMAQRSGVEIDSIPALEEVRGYCHAKEDLYGAFLLGCEYSVRAEQDKVALTKAISYLLDVADTDPKEGKDDVQTIAAAALRLADLLRWAANGDETMRKASSVYYIKAARLGNYDVFPLSKQKIDAAAKSAG